MDDEATPEVCAQTTKPVYREPSWIRFFNRFGSVAIPVGIYLAIGILLLVSYAIWPDMIPKWLLWIVFAPVFLLLLFIGEVLGELVFHVVTMPFKLLAKIPPFSWLAWWVRCEDGEGEPVLRFAVIAFGFLAVFLFALKLLYPK